MSDIDDVADNIYNEMFICNEDTLTLRAPSVCKSIIAEAIKNNISSFKLTIEEMYGEVKFRDRRIEYYQLMEQRNKTNKTDVLEYLRNHEWMVAVHNDYKLGGKLHTFWLLTNPSLGRFVKGEGETDEEALGVCKRQADFYSCLGVKLMSNRDYEYSMTITKSWLDKTKRNARERMRAKCERIAREHPVKFGPLDDPQRQSDAEMGSYNARHQIADAIKEMK